MMTKTSDRERVPLECPQTLTIKKNKKIKKYRISIHSALPQMVMDICDTKI